MLSRSFAWALKSGGKASLNSGRCSSAAGLRKAGTGGSRSSFSGLSGCSKCPGSATARLQSLRTSSRNSSTTSSSSGSRSRSGRRVRRFDGKGSGNPGARVVAPHPSPASAGASRRTTPLAIPWDPSFVGVVFVVVSVTSTAVFLMMRGDRVIDPVTGEVSKQKVLKGVGGDKTAQCSAAEGGDSTALYRTISRAEVAEHCTPETGVWVTYKDGVYDITEFARGHPGGAKRIMMAAGGSIEPFWKLYAVHNSEDVKGILEGLRIGTLPEEDMVPSALPVDESDPFSGDPLRHPAFTINSAKPFNAEPPSELLIDAGFITPNDLFYVRNHLPVPNIDPNTYELEVGVEGSSKQPLKLSLADLKANYQHVKVVSSVQCAGNRRNQMTPVKAVKGLNWSFTAISTAEWTGVRLRDVLASAGMDVDADSDDGAPGRIQHVQFEGLDRDLTTCYGASIPAHKAVDRQGDVILAFEMNGEDVPRDHGFPVRLIVPGVTGARNVKWLGKVTASTEESDNHWQKKDYKGFSPNVDWDNVDFESAPAIQEMPVTSAICSPTEGSAVSPYSDSIPVKGYAWSGGGRGIVRVDVSSDGGDTWVTAKLAPTGQPLHRTWAWTPWEVDMPMPVGKGGSQGGGGEEGGIQLMCKATDSSYNVQPETIAPFWNLRGVLANNWHKVPLRVEEEDE